MQKRAQAPEINCFAAILLQNNFRGGVFRHPRNGENIFLASFDFFRESEIGQFDVPFLIDHDVLGFQIPVDDIPAVHIFEGEYNLRDVEFGSE